MLLLTLAGVAAALLLVDAVGLRAVAHAVLAIGGPGFAVYLAYSLVVFGVLGLAWHAAAPGVPARRAWLFAWARVTREAAADILPFAQVGGLVVGARTVATHGVDEPTVYASMVVDLTTEMASQLVVTLFGIGILLLVLAGGPPGQSAVLHAAFAGLALAVAMMLAFVFAQRPALALAERLGARMLPGSVAAMAAVRRRLAGIYAMRGRVLAAFLLNLLAWIMSAAGAWIALAFMGAHVPLWAVLTIESLVFAVRSAAFVIPGAIGVQEGAYLLLAPLFGLDPGLALALSLVKRARDLAIGAPALALWQIGEARGLIRRPSTAR